MEMSRNVSEVFMDGIASIDGGTALKELINERGLKQI